MTAEPLFTKPVFTVLDDLLDLVEVLHADDPLVRVGDVVGRDGALVLDLLLRDEVWCVDFLEKQVAFVFLVHQHLLDDISVPFSPTKLGLDVLAFQVVLDVRVGAAFQKHLEDQPDGFGFFFNDLDTTVFGSCVAHEVPIRDAVGAFFVFLPDTPFYVFGNAAAFFLRQGGHDGQQQLAFAIKGPDILFLEEDLHVMFFELTNGCQRVDRVSGKPADGLGDDQVDLVVHVKCNIRTANLCNLKMKRTPCQGQ